MSQIEKVVEKDRDRIVMKNEESLQLMLRKNKDYGSSFRTGGYLGCFMDMRSVFSRLIQMTYKGFNENKWNKAKLRDKLQDIRNFAVLAEICLDEDLFMGAEDSDKELFINLEEAAEKFPEKMSKAETTVMSPIVASDYQPRKIGTDADNESKLIQGTCEGKKKKAWLRKEQYSKLNHGCLDAGVKNISIRLTDYPQRERFEKNLARILAAPFGNYPSREFTEEEIKSAWEKLSSFYSVAAPLQFAVVEFELSGVSRTLTHQLVRTRLASYMQQTTRVCYAGDKFDIRMPFSIASSKEARKIFENLAHHSREAYIDLCNLGIPLEDARFVAPVGIETYIIARYPLNIFFQVYSQRACPMMQWEICWVVREMKRLLSVVWPELTKFMKLPCEFSKKCNKALTIDQRAELLCNFPWAGEE